MVMQVAVVSVFAEKNGRKGDLQNRYKKFIENVCGMVLMVFFCGEKMTN